MQNTGGDGRNYTPRQRLAQWPRRSTTAHLHSGRLGTTSLSYLQVYIKWTESVQGIRYSYS